MRPYRDATVMAVLAGTLVIMPALARADDGGGSFLGRFHTIRTLASTVPANGDLNPYGVAVVPRATGTLHQGAILVSNFNNSANQQGTGTTIVQITPHGTMSLFAHIDAASLPGPCPGGVGLTTALVVLRSGWVIVGSLPTTDGTAATAQAGCLLVLNNRGTVVKTITGPLINGPWDMTAVDTSGSDSHDNGNSDNNGTVVLFVTNVLNGTVTGGGAIVNQGTVVRLTLALQQGHTPHLLSSTVIGSGFPERTDPAALVIGPTGLGLAAGEGGSRSGQGNGDSNGADVLQRDGHSGHDGSRPGWYAAPADDGGNDTLYVADSLNNRIAAIPDALTRLSSAGTGVTVAMDGALNDPLGLAIAPNGDIVTVNGNDGNAVETTPHGSHIATTLLDSTGSPPGAGALFGLAVVPNGDSSGNNGGQDDETNAGLYFVDDATNTLNLLH